MGSRLTLVAIGGGSECRKTTYEASHLEMLDSLHDGQGLVARLHLAMGESIVLGFSFLMKRPLGVTELSMVGTDLFVVV